VKASQKVSGDAEQALERELGIRNYQEDTIRAAREAQEPATKVAQGI